MIASLTGKIESKGTNSVVINVNGVGFIVNVPSGDKFDSNKFPLTIYTHLYVREDRITLYGFSEESECKFFKILLDTRGIGPKVALNIISEMGPERFQHAVLTENLSDMSTIPGIGIKSAKKMVLELKEKFKLLKSDWEIVAEEGKKDLAWEGIEALKGLGYSEKEAKQRIMNTLAKTPELSSLKLEDLIKEALQK
ncbi:MAG: Holliday junction branch migration protein RuvA [Candidatus Atribacteria bacterium]|nr:Holliday junction branch migration protein RuvA [Candidatus Atribacteria bacterium]